MTASNPQYRLAVQELMALRAELSKAEQSNNPKVAGSGAEYIAKYRDFKYHEALFELMAKQYEIARLDEAREGTLIQVIDVALPPERKSKPRKALIAIISALTAFLFVAIFLILKAAFRVAEAEPAFAAKVDRLRSFLRRPRPNG
jgi:uncharacterized protein involved in exopolysaccharide biosynthesis